MAVAEIMTLGFASIDHFCVVHPFPVKGQKQAIRNYEKHGGGQAATAGVALKRWGECVRFVGRVGDDQNGDLSLQLLENEGIDISGAIRSPGATTQFAVILVDPESGERTILWSRSPRLDLKPEDLKPEWFQDVRTLLIDGHERDAALMAAKWVQSQGGKVVLDAEEIGPGREELLAFTDVCVASTDFGLREFGETNHETTLKLMLEMGVGIAGVTLGEEGVVVDWGEGIRKFPALDIHARDTTGAGDIFHAALTYCVHHDWEPERMFNFANICAGLSCRKIGGRTAIPNMEEVQRVLENGRAIP